VTHWLDDPQPELGDEPTERDVHVWTILRDRAIRDFGGKAPRAADEQAVLNVWLRQPQLVERAVESIAAAHASGRITWPWSALRGRVEKETTPVREAVVVGADERVGRSARAERWLRIAGFHLVTEAQVVDELFGRGGTLEPFAGDAELELRMLELWRSLEPVREQVEREALERARRAIEVEQRRHELEQQAAAERQAQRDAARAELAAANGAGGNPFLDGSLE
jgi:hypothetical protein